MVIVHFAQTPQKIFPQKLNDHNAEKLSSEKRESIHTFIENTVFTTDYGS